MPRLLVPAVEAFVQDLALVAEVRALTAMVV